jgi:hypothetical protein
VSRRRRGGSLLPLWQGPSSRLTARRVARRPSQSLGTGSTTSVISSTCHRLGPRPRPPPAPLGPSAAPARPAAPRGQAWGAGPPRPRAPLGPARAPAVAGACASPPLSPGRPGRRGTGGPPRESQAQATRRGGANPRPVRRTPRGPGAVPPPRCTASSPLARPRSPASACGREREEPVAQLFGFLAEAHGRNARALDGSAQPLGGPPRLGARPAFAVPWACSPLEPDGRPSSVRPGRAGRAGRTPR